MTATEKDRKLNVMRAKRDVLTAQIAELVARPITPAKKAATKTAAKKPAKK